MEPVRGGTLATLCEESRSIFRQADSKSSIASWAIRYAASKQNVIVVLSGMSNEAQTKDNIRTLSHFRPINEKDQNVIDRALSAFLRNRTIPCTGCRYCMPCPQGVDIPRMFSLYNEYALSHHENDFIESYEEESQFQSSRCIACGQCKRRCPQKIDISLWMNEITELYLRLKKNRKEE
jgi:hypothetical protein